MATALNEDDEQAHPSPYEQLWQEAVDVDDEVQRILHDHGLVELPVLEPSEDEEEEEDYYYNDEQ